jgi:MerR family transcriptional regulator, light-induced transcriptional regulator
MTSNECAGCAPSSSKGFRPPTRRKNFGRRRAPRCRPRARSSRPRGSPACAFSTRFDAPRLEAELARLSLLFDAVSLYEQIVSPLLFEVGRRWGEGTLSIAQEHFLSERLEAAVRGALKALERPEGPLVLVACLDRDQHVFGMLGAALRLAASGARVVVLGAMTPPEAVADAVAALSPSLVGLSACIAPKAPRALLRAYARACAGLPWVLGGPAAEALRAPVAKAGGFVALGAARDWQAHVRECLRAHPAA